MAEGGAGRAACARVSAPRGVEGRMAGAVPGGPGGSVLRHGGGAAAGGGLHAGERPESGTARGRSVPADLHGTVDLVLTSPPYGSSVHGQVRSTRETGERGVLKQHHRYGHDRANLAHVSTDQLLDAFTQILTQCRTMLRPGGTAVVTTRPWRERGELIDLPSAVLAAGQAAGLTPTERCVALLAGIRDNRLVPRPSFFQMKNTRDARRTGIPLSVIQHEDVLVFTRPDTRPPRCPNRVRTCVNGRHRGRHGHPS